MAVSSTILLKFSGAAVQRGLAAIKKGFSSLNKEGGKMFTSLIGGAAKWAAILGPLAAGAAFTKLAMGASETASNFEQMRMKFLMFTGTLEGAKKLFEQLRKVDLVSNLDLETLGDGAAKLMAYGAKADDVAGILEKLSKVSGGSKDAFDGLTLAFGQTMANGSLKGDDLRQYVERGWNPLQQIIARTGETMEQVRGRMENHKVTLKEVETALDDVTAGTGRFARAHELGAKTFLAATSRMQSQWALLQDSFGTPLNMKLIEIFDQITNKLPQLTSQAKAFGDEVGSILSSGFNSIGNGDFVELLKSGFMVAATVAGEKLVASLIYGGTIIGNQFRDLLRSLEVAGIKTSVGDNVPMTWGQASNIASNTFNSDDAKNHFSDVIDRNKTPMVPPTAIATTDESNQIMKDVRELIAKQLEQMKGVNRSLAPQP